MVEEMTFPTEIQAERVVTPKQMEAVAADGTTDAALLKGMLARARKYLQAFRWCGGIANVYFGGGIGGVVAAFLVQLDDKRARNVDEWLWVVVGDVPSAFFVTERAGDGPAALRVYCDLMEEWVDAARGNRSLSDVFPIEGAPADVKHADMLASRIGTMRDEIIPDIELQMNEVARKVAGSKT